MRWKHWALVILLGLLVAVALFLWPRPLEKKLVRPIGKPRVETSRAAPPEPEYVPAETCAPCHIEEWKAWTGSHHDLAIDVATSSTVLGDFSGAVVKVDGVSFRFFQNEGKYFVETTGADGKLAPFEVVYVFGVDPLQQVLLGADGGRLQSLTVAWDVKKKRWFDLYPDQIFRPDDHLHWTGRYQRWNAMCADCHSTALDKAYDPTTDRYQTKWADLDVGCQACHGPGSQHLAQAEGGEIEKGESGLRMPTSQAAQLDTCSPCHARRSRLEPKAEPNKAFLERYRPALLSEGLYFADGQIRDEVYVYGSFVQSKMYVAGVTCSDCHDPHGLSVKLEGNALCTQCHSELPPKDRFEQLAERAKNYDDPAHHHHPVGKPGSGCVDCHMPERTYMVVDPRRDHSFRVPRPDLSVGLDVPNTCTACHSDRKPQWAADKVADWFGPQRPVHFAQVLSNGRKGRPEAAAPLAKIAIDESWPAIVRASALELLSTYGSIAVSTKLALLSDSSALVRYAAVQGLEVLPPEERVKRLVPRLDDERRLVRSTAARSLLGVPRSLFGETGWSAFQRELAVYETAQAQDSDLPSGAFNLALVREAQGDAGGAIGLYRKAIDRDPSFIPARANLAMLLHARGEIAEAEQMYRAAIAIEPEHADLHYSLGLLLAEANRLEDAVVELGKAAKLSPDRPRMRYNHALALQQLGRVDDAKRELAAAQALEPNNPDFVHALVMLLVQQKKWEEALPFAERLVELAPGDPGARSLLEGIKQQASSPK